MEKIEFIEELLDELDLSPTQNISTLMAVLEEMEASEDLDSLTDFMDELELNPSQKISTLIAELEDAESDD